MGYQHQKIPYSKPIAKKVQEMVTNGVAIKVILDSIQTYQNAPKSMQTFYNLYGDDIAQARGNFQNALGAKAWERIEADSDRILELALRSKAGWNPSQNVTITEGDPDAPDESTSAIEELKTLLGRGDPEEDDNPEEEDS